MVQNLIYWRYGNNTLVISGESIDSYNEWQVPTTISSFNQIPWGEYRNSIESVIILYSINVKTMNYWFYNCSNLDTFRLDSGISINNVTTMNSCFQGCTSFNQSITIPNTVTTMNSCFRDCTSFNQSITIPNSVTTMTDCFRGCTAFNSSVTFQATSKVTTMDHCFFYCTSFNQPITIPNSVTNMYYCFSNCTALNSTVTFQATSKVTTMDHCFYGCTNFDKSITIPNSVTNMHSCFSNCTALNSQVTFQATSKVASMYACFYGCKKFDQSITIPNSVTNMYYCFSNCTALNSSVTFQATSKVASMYYCFSGCKKFDQSITIPNNVTDMDHCFYGCTNFDKSITIPNNVTDMDFCFSGCTALNSSVTFQATSKVASMYYCFDGCISFNQPITIPNSVTDMDFCFNGCTAFNSSVTFQATSKVAFMYNCFHNCKKFNQSIIIPNSVTTMSYCFYGCTNFNSTVTFQATSKVANMESCFYGCTNFDKSITIPNSVTNIHSCFSGCTNLDSPVNFQATSKFTNMYCCFFGCKKFNQSIIIPDSVTNMGECFSGCTNFNQSITIPNSVTVMSLCFYNCTAFNSQVTFQATSKVDDMSACFSGCTNFNKSITIPNSVTEMDSCFRNCKNLNDVIIINKTNQAISYTDMFFGTEELIVLDRRSTISIESLEQLAATANNSNVKVNNLAILSSSATRNTENSSQIDIVVEVSDSYSHNIDIDICGSPSTSSSRADVLWYNNPGYVGNPLSELEIDGSNDSTTFYGLIEDIDTDNSLSLFVICHYSLIETSFQELRIGSSYYTMDFLAGGKEIAIGVGASPDDIYSEVNETYNIPFTNEMFKTSDTNIDINKAYYDYDENREPKYQLVNLSQYTEDVLESINPSELNTTYKTPWYDVFQETEFYQRINRTEYERLGTKPQNWMDISSYIQIASEVEEGFEYTVSTLSGKWKIEIGIQFLDDTSGQIYWNAGIFDYGISKTYRSVRLVEVFGETYRITIGYNSQNNKIIMSRIGDFSYKVNYYMRTTPLYFTLSSTRGIFKCGMDAIFRSKQAPEVFKSMYDLMYPVGSCYTTSTKTNPGAWLGGKWSLITKQFTPAWSNLTPSWNNTYTNSAENREFSTRHIGNTIEFRARWYAKDISDTTRNIFNIPWSTLGLTGLPHAIYTQLNADGANAIGLGFFSYLTTYNSSGTATSTDKTKAALHVVDWVTKATTYPTPPTDGYSVAASFIMTVGYTSMLDSFCNQFIWKRIS